MTPTIITVPGFNSDGKYMWKCHNVWRAYSFHDLYHFGYNENAGMVSRALTRWRNDRVIEQLWELLCQIDGDVILVGHSNGASIIHGIVNNSTDGIAGVVTVNGALDRDADIPNSLPWWHNWYSKSDWVLSLARYRPWHDWGALGRGVYEGSHLRTTSFNMEGYTHGRSVGHSSVFNDPIVLDAVWPNICENAASAYSNWG